MYFPYFRGKQFELETLLEVSPAVYSNTIPIVEPINFAKRRLYAQLANRSISFILIVNPFYPTLRLTTAQVQDVIDNELNRLEGLVLGFIIDSRFDSTELSDFLLENPMRGKALIFQNNPIPRDLTAIQDALAGTPVSYIIFDSHKTNDITRSAFIAHPQPVIITDGFVHMNRNADYPPVSTFTSRYNTWRGEGLHGIGDYLSVGDQFSEGGGPAYVVTLHLTIREGANLLMHHFSSTVHSTVQTFTAAKFLEANTNLVGSPFVMPLTSGGLLMYRDWHARTHNPQLGAAKKASMIHHMELMSSIV